MNRQDEEFEHRVRTTLDSSVTALDADTRRRLAASRAQAFEHKSWLARWMQSGNWVPATAFASVAVLAVTLFVANRHSDSPVQVAQSDTDAALELLLDGDDNADTVSDPDFFIVMDAMLDEEDAKNAG
jgi:anti-sigma-K factor RskA